MTKLKSISFDQRNNTVGPRSISKQELIKEYMEIGVKNDDALIKMATIVQRALQNQDEDGGLGISEEEKEQLLAEMEKISKENK